MGRKKHKKKRGNMGQGTMWGGYSGTPATYYPKCSHTGSDVVFTDEERNITLAGATGSFLNPRYADLVIDCAGQYTEPTQVSRIRGTQRYVEALSQFVKKAPDCIKIHWPDQGEPELTGMFWIKLWEMIPNDTRVVACCVGGHGRTGTALACLLIASGLKPTEAYWKVRDEHCKEAIETKTQVMYILDVWKDKMVSDGVSLSDISKNLKEEIDILYPPKKHSSKHAESNVPKALPPNIIPVGSGSSQSTNPGVKKYETYPLTPAKSGVMLTKPIICACCTDLISFTSELNFIDVEEAKDLITEQEYASVSAKATKADRMVPFCNSCSSLLEDVKLYKITEKIDDGEEPTSATQSDPDATHPRLLETL